ncbi:hypothetical protein [Mycobacteroides abscessus]|uniref:hypothetical protein n=1 Tax=Mycobacteroides abscessus TaxID=36809 RepID=UPI000925AC23|nr:hypothetical protein [Mycobacteroides abscessus]RIS84040.1 hypothetical protein D2E44_13185 [Mycobacteroides abscessus]SHO82784.1 Uncharacterised protein [Mycobacteroides abscessus subsp. abscessus]SHP59851.1 Uncharacterised protein [Mycobacteroides abscessus subsp. abscessus]SHP82410.1 Uncharacterised protein [Mycobacteroides abscessus subsp. abscessus]SHP94709.1 Uncharacterised protein [Mycobacteroides abscessus subsp. abscessus]
MSTEEEMWKVLNQRADQQADRWFKPAGIGLLAGVIGTAIAVSNHPPPTWAVVMAGLGWLVCLVSFAIPMSGAYRDGNRLEAYVNSMADYPDDDFDDDDELDDDEEFSYPAVTEPAQSPVTPAPSAGGGLLSSLRQQGQ